MKTANNLGMIYRPRVRNALLTSLQPTVNKMVETSKQLEDMHSQAYFYVGIVTYNIVLRNQLIIESILNTAKSVMTNKSLYRQDTKKYVNAAVKTANAYNTMVKDIMGYQDDMMDTLKTMSAEYTGNIQNHMMIFYYSLKQEMDSANVEDTVIRANVEYCSVLLELAKQSQDCMEESNVLLAAKIKNLGYLRLTTLQAEWEKVRHNINGRYINPSVNLNTPRCTLACENLQKAMSDFNMIARLMQK